MSSGLRHFYRFGTFRLDATEHLLYRQDGEVVPLKPKVVETLELLVRERGRLIGKQEFMDRLWPDTIVEESNLSQNIYLLRKVLGTADNGRGYIETVPKRGYRFTAQVEEISEIGSAPVLSGAAREPGEVSPIELVAAKKSTPPLWRKPVALLLVVLVSGSALTFAVVRFVRRSAREKSREAVRAFQNVKLRRITDSGDIADATISRDGRIVAYATNNNAIWIQNLATGSRRQLVAESEQESRANLVFSPDGNQLYFYSEVNGRKVQLLCMPVLGGAAHKVLEDFQATVAISPDGKQFALLRWDTARGDQSLIISDGTSERVLATRKLPNYFELWGETVAWSPDGKHVACVEWLKNNAAGTGSILVVNANDGSEMRLANQGRNWNSLYDLTWLPTGDGLLVVAREDASSDYQVWRVSYPDGEWRKVTNDLNDYAKLSVSAGSDRMVTVQQSDFSNLWILPQGDIRRAHQVTFGSGRTDGWAGLAWTPDGKVIFSSNASGSPQIWIADAGGANLKQLTFDREPSSQPFVSPDGRFVIFKSSRSGGPHIWRMELDGSNLSQITNGPGESWPVVTPDGRNVIYTSATSPFSTLWSISLSGDGAPQQLTNIYATENANVSPDGKLLVAGFYDPESASPWRLGIFTASGGKPLASFDKPFRGLARWTSDSRSVVYMDNGNTAIWKQAVQGGAPVKLLSLMPQERIYSFAYSPDGTQMIISRGRPQSDALLIEDLK